MSAEAHRFNEISNLRAFAVVVVLIFHFWPSAAPGGFIGVDIFFIVSGFVVAAAYFERVGNRVVSVREFLWRRVRRLLPAALVVVLSTWVIGLVLLEPNELLLLAQSILSQVLYVQNLFFLVGGDYFHGALDKPLLHTWSLAVEEQFYLLFPVVAIASARLRRTLPLLAGLALVSVIGAFLVARLSPKTAFFLLPTRAWELLLGMVCWSVRERLERHRPVPRWAYAVGALMLFVSAFAFDERAVFPDAQALVAAAGTAIILLTLRTDRGTQTYAVLEWLGERSYSLYLWHWPLYVFAVREHGASPARVVAVAVATLVATELSYRTIENPIRSRRLLKEQHSLAVFAGAGVAVMVALFVVTSATGGLPGRYPAPADALFAQAVEQNHGRCGLVARATNPGASACQVGGSGERGILVIGDSHADAMDEQLALLGGERGFRVYLADTACDVCSLTGKVFRCGETYRTKLIQFTTTNRIDRVLLISSWSGLKEAPTREAIAAFRAAGLMVVVSGPLPGGDDFDPAVQARRSLATPGYSVPAQIPLAKRNDVVVEALMNGLAFDAGIRLVWPQTRLCVSSSCDFATDGEANFYDDGHLTTAGAMRVLPAYVDAFDD